MTARRNPVVTELRLAAVVAAYTVLFGNVAGLVWAALTPRPDPLQTYLVQPEASHELMGMDVWFAGVGLVAGVITAAVVLLVLRRTALGPGPVLGLAAGGILAALVADRVGYLVHGTRTVQALGRLGVLRSDDPDYLGRLASLIDFRVHSSGVLFIWPAVAVIVLGLAAVLAREPKPPGVPSGAAEAA